MFRRDSFLLGQEVQGCQCLGEGRGKSMGETEGFSIFRPPTNLFIPCVPLLLSRESVSSTAEAKAEEVSSCEESLSESTKGELCQSSCSSGWFYSAWVEGVCVLSTWSAGSEHLGFSGSSRIPLGVLLNTRWLVLGNIAPTQCSNLNNHL